MNSLFLQIFILVNVFLIGALTMVAIRHALAHFKPHDHDAEKTRPAHETVQLSHAIKERLMKQAEAKLQTVLDRSAVQLERSLTETTGRLDRQLERLGSKIISDEMARYNKALDDLQAHTQLSISGAQAEISQHQDDLKEKLAGRQAELEAKLTADMAAEKERLVAELDTKLADAVTSFLLETMTHEVDLGAQNAYIVKMLDEHKDEITKGVKSEA
jgi:F0F1-type ATP synthase membrane subunit b/b'